MTGAIFTRTIEHNPPSGVLSYESGTLASIFKVPTWWAPWVSLGVVLGVFRDQICTTQGPKVDCVMQVDF